MAANVACMVAMDRVSSWTSVDKDSSVRGGAMDEDVVGLGTDGVEIGSVAEEASGWMVVDGGPDIQFHIVMDGRGATVPTVPQ